MTTKPKLITADELLLMPDDGYEYELVRGLLTAKMPPPGDGHGDVTGRFALILGGYCEGNDYGVIRDNAGFRLESNPESNPDTVRAPDGTLLKGRRCGWASAARKFGMAIRSAPR